MREFEGKTVIVTGGSRGIGRACCLAFAQGGANIVFTYKSSKKEADSLKKELRNLQVKYLAIQTDVRNYEQCSGVVELTLKRFRRLDVLINNAGVIRDRSLMMMTQEDWKEVIETNLEGVFNMTKAAIITFLKQKQGRIINMSSVSGLVGLARQTNYSASKAGIIGFSKALSKEVAAYNIRVNTVCPGYIETDMTASLKENLKEEILKDIPLKRFGKPEEVAALCVFLASCRASYITGEAIKIDGGLAI
jgi:3-oxoacyl-[acyl-carrier protein] reductase